MNINILQSSSLKQKSGYVVISTKSRHTVVCRAAKKPARNTCEYIDRKKENVILAPP